jgi:hypothetical protein
MKKLTVFVLLAMLLITSVASGETLTEQVQKQMEIQERATEIVNEVYGEATEENLVGVFKTHGYVDLDLAVYYRTFYDKTLLPFEQLYFDLFEYEKLEQLFSNPEIKGFIFAYYYNLVGGDYDKVFTGTITREAFESIDLELYDEVWYFDYLEIKQADKRLFPQFYY